MLFEPKQTKNRRENNEQYKKNYIGSQKHPRMIIKTEKSKKNVI